MKDNIFCLAGKVSVPEEKKNEMNRHVLEILDKCGIRKTVEMTVAGKKVTVVISARPDAEGIVLFDFFNFFTNILFLYSMSSGQLSAVALAFLLCMNQVYGSRRTCSVLLIDDPVQTIDDVNMVGIVDILRYGFADRQIFVSTHEKKFEWFLRYRYAKAGKTVKIFNMKELMLQEN